MKHRIKAKAGHLTAIEERIHSLEFLGRVSEADNHTIWKETTNLSFKKGLESGLNKKHI